MLSDEDRAAIQEVRERFESGEILSRGALDRVLKLAGEEPLEPADLTFWFDTDESDVWMRDDRAAAMVHGSSNLDRWFRTGDDRKFSWIQVHGESPKLVELVRVDAASRKAGTILYELASAWQAWHHDSCGRSVQLSVCTYHECRQHWSALIGYGLDSEGDQF